MNRIVVFTGILLLLAMNVFAVDELKPVMYFSFDKDTKDVIEDLSGNKNNGKIFGSGKIVDGKFGKGISLGLPDTVDVVHSETLVFTDELTVGIWVNLDSTANQKIIGKSPIGSGWVLGVSGGIYPECWDKAGTNHTVTVGSVSAKTWTHLAMTYSSKTKAMILYIDGKEAGRLDNGGQPIGDNTNLLVIGASPWGKDWSSSGIYDEAKLYNVAFDADQVTNSLMAEGIGAKAAVSQKNKTSTMWGTIKHIQ
jgi:hypothetical protein